MADASADWIERGKEYVAAKWAKFTENWLDMEEWETDDSDVVEIALDILGDEGVQ